MSVSGVNVLRWSALAYGVFYGVSHQRSLVKQERHNEIQRKQDAEQSLIAKAKAEYLNKTMPKDKLTASGGVISDPDNPKFDLEAFLKMKETDGAK